MRRPLVLFLVLLLGVAGPRTGRGQRLPDSLSARIDAVFADRDRSDVPGAVVAVVQEGQVVYARGYGSANLEYDVPITPETPFLVASVSKQFTAFAVAMLADQGRVDLDADVRTYIPEVHAFDPPITLRHLIHHTSGLRDEFELLGLAGYHMDDVITREAILRLAYRQRSLNFVPGAEYLYCNTGYTLLAEVVERVTGESFRAWTTEHLFVPLEMDDSRFLDDHGELLAGRAQGYYVDEGVLRKQVMNYASVGASGLVTTALDLAKWATNYDTGTVGGPRVQAMVHERGVLTGGDTLSYAFGQSHGYHRGHRRVSHSGWHRGFRTYLVRFPEDDLAVIVLSNLDSYDPVEPALKVADLFLEPIPVAGYAGTFVSDELGTAYRMVVRDGSLYATHRRYEDIPLTPTDRDVFVSEAWFLETVRFTRTDGRISGFLVTNDRARNINFVKQ